MNSQSPPPADLQELFGNIDIYWFDQLLKGRVTPGMRILDAGAGDGRNLVYLLRVGYEVFAVDASESAVQRLRDMAAQLAPQLPVDNFRVASIERLPFAEAMFDVVISSAVLHFADDEEHFYRMLHEMWRVLAAGGLFFCRVASLTGIENEVRQLENRRYALPDGTERFLVDESLLQTLSANLGATLVEPIKTVRVAQQRCMATWCLRKGAVDTRHR